MGNGNPSDDVRILGLYGMVFAIQLQIIDGTSSMNRVRKQKKETCRKSKKSFHRNHLV